MLASERQCCYQRINNASTPDKLKTNYSGRKKVPIPPERARSARTPEGSARTPEGLPLWTVSRPYQGYYLLFLPSVQAQMLPSNSF